MTIELPPSTKKVLVIDDDVELTELLKEYLAQHALEVIESHDGDAGMEALRRSSPDLVILDVVIDGAVIGRVPCDMPRPDLLAAGYGTATAGFGFMIPEAFLDGAAHALTVRYADGVCLPLLSPNTADPFAFRLGTSPA